MKKKILVTGASGHLGGMLFKSLAKIGYSNLLGTDLKKKNIHKKEKFILGNLKNIKDTLKMTKGGYAIVHFGAIPIEDTQQNILQNNIIGTYNLFEAARVNKVKRIIFASIKLYIRGKTLTEHIKANDQISGKRFGRFMPDPRRQTPWQELGIVAHIGN